MVAFPTPMVLSAATAPIVVAESVLASLPATARAQVAWATKPIAEGLAELGAAPLTDERVASVAERLAPVLATVARAGWELATNADEHRAALMQALERDQALLSPFLTTDDARDTLGWVVGVFRSLIVVGANAQMSEQRASVDEAAWSRLATSPELLPLWRGLIALMAALEEAKRNGDPLRAAELLDVSFLELTEFRARAQRYGAGFPLFPFETTDQRREEAHASLARLRGALAEGDLVTLGEARLRDLR